MVEGGCSRYNHCGVWSGKSKVKSLDNLSTISVTIIFMVTQKTDGPKLRKEKGNFKTK